MTARCRVPRAARGRVDHLGPGGAWGDTPPPGPTRRVGQAPAPGAWLGTGPPHRCSPHGEPAAGCTALPPPASDAVSRARCRERPARAGRQPPALSSWTAGPHRRDRRRRARPHGEAAQRTGGAGARRQRSPRRPAHQSPHDVWHVPRAPAASHHAAGAVSVCAAARPRVSAPAPSQLLRRRAGDAVVLLGGAGHRRPALAPARLAWPHRQPRAPRARLASPRRRPDAGPLVSGGRRWRTPPARAVDRPGSCHGARPLWVPEGAARGTRRGDAAPGASAPAAPVMTTHLSLPTVWDTCVTARRVRQPRASPHPVASDRDPCSGLGRLAPPRLGTAPSAWTRDALEAPGLGSCLAHLEPAPGPSARRRHVRRAAMHACVPWASRRAPSQGGVLPRVWAIPRQRHDRPPSALWTGAAIDARLAAPAQQTWAGRRDRT